MSEKNKITYVSLPVSDLSADKVLPGPIFLCIAHKMVRYKHKEDTLESAALDKLLFNQVRFIFIEQQDQDAFEKWVLGNDETEQAEIQAATPEEAKPIVEASIDQRRAMMDIFAAARNEPQVRTAVESSKKIVTEFLKKPFALNNISALQRHSKGSVDHSVNVSTLAVYLGLRMGYSHQLILENLALGGLFHDLGKTAISKPGEMLADDDPIMQKHPLISREMLEKSKDKIPNEVLLIVAQHHEYLDGSGYPQGLKGLAIYDLARLISIANIYDNLVTESKAESMKDRAQEALDILEKDFEGKLDPRKLEKAIKILRYSLI